MLLLNVIIKIRQACDVAVVPDISVQPELVPALTASAEEEPKVPEVPVPSGPLVAPPENPAPCARPNRDAGLLWLLLAKDRAMLDEETGEVSIPNQSPFSTLRQRLSPA